ncbi:MAG TPA: hypothetical protein VIK03_08150 [Thermoleophilia bacterium]
MPTPAWVSLGLIWLLNVVLTVCIAVVRDRKAPGSPPRPSARADTIITWFISTVLVVPAALLVLGEPLAVAAYWLLALFSLGYTLVLIATLWSAHKLAE